MFGNITQESTPFGSTNPSMLRRGRRTRDDLRDAALDSGRPVLLARTPNGDIDITPTPEVENIIREARGSSCRPHVTWSGEFGLMLGIRCRF